LLLFGATVFFSKKIASQKYDQVTNKWLSSSFFSARNLL
jgi:hypothetical protein